MKAFNNDQSQKDLYVNRMKDHAKADEIIQGTGWENGKGCFIGCTFHNYDHKKFESESIGPIWLARLADKIFEGLDKKNAKQFATDFYPAINLGSNLEKIKIPMLIFIVDSARENFDHKKYPKQLAAIDGVLKELRRKKLDFEKLRKARAAAYAAAAYAADAAAYAAAAAAAAYAAAAADAAAAAYADAAAAAAAYADDRTKTYKKFADKILEIMRECK